MHFTYAEPLSTELKQGDILKKTPELTALLKEVHPHYAREDYLYFQVLTQSCDLVRRGQSNECKTRYITLAAVRSLDLIIKRAIDKFSEKIEFDNKNVCSESHKSSLKDLFNKLLNNNDTQHFYLKAEPSYGLLTDCCTQLHLSISIRAYEHFEICLNAKILELDENFRAKLGWLVGNLYSRVGTNDYVPYAIPDIGTYDNFIKDLMDSYVVWIPTSEFAKFKIKAKISTSFEDVTKKIAIEKSRTRDTQLNQIVNSITKLLDTTEPANQKEMLKNMLGSHPVIQKALNK